MSDIRNIELYYIGGDGRENRPHPIMYGESIIFTPPLGEKFPVLFTELEADRLIKNSAFTDKGRTFFSVTRDRRVANALKQGRTLDEVIENAGAIALTNEQLLQELEKRKLLEQTEKAPVKKRATTKAKVEAELNG
jgi:hypothetical protein